MANTQKMKLKAQAIKEKAIGTFTNAIAEVEKANSFLASAISEDEIEMNTIANQIENLYSKLDYVQSEKINKEAEVIGNKELIAKLEQFTK